MARVAIQSVDVFEGPAYETVTEDGPAAVWDCYAWATLADGTEYCHVTPFRQRHRAADLVAKIEAAGSIDLAYWVEQDPPMSLEERWGLYAEREQEVRFCMRSEDEMYHGIPYH